MNGLIGFTGFVGTNLLQKQRFDYLFNSQNISSIKNKSMDILICAGAPGSMQHANRNFQEDRQNIELLIQNITQSKPRKLILISTIAIFQDFSSAKDESNHEYELKLGYGVNRRYLETELVNRLPDVHIIRLPALFGINLKKNFLFDILNNAPSFFSLEKFSELRSKVRKRNHYLLDFYQYNSAFKVYMLNREELNSSNMKVSLESLLDEFSASSIFFHSSNTTFQFYNLDSLWTDICKVIEDDLPIVHLAPEPVRTGEIYKNFFLTDMPYTNAQEHHEKIITRHSKLWGSNSTFIKNQETVSKEINSFLKACAR